MRKILYIVAAAWVLAFIWQTYAHANDVGYKCGGTTVQVSRDTLHIVHEPGAEATVNIKVQTDYSSKRFPVVRYEIEKDELTVNGKHCKVDYNR